MDAGFFTRKVGGLAMWEWIALGVAALLVYTTYFRSSTAGSNSTDPNAPPPAGTGSGVMPYVFLLPQGVDNAPSSQSVATFPTSPRVPGVSTSQQEGAFGFSWTPYTVLGLQESRKTAADTSPAGIATVAYGLNKNDTTNAAYFASLITTNNPGIDWSRPLPVGTVVMIPQLNVVPQGAQQTQFN